MGSIVGSRTTDGMEIEPIGADQRQIVYELRFEAVSTSQPRSRKARLNPSLIMLLEAGAEKAEQNGVPNAKMELIEYLCKLQAREAERLQVLSAPKDGARPTKAERLEVLRKTANMRDADSNLLVSPVKMIEAGFSMNEPKLQSMLQSLYDDGLDGLRKGRVPVEEGYVAFGVPDPTGTLKEGEVCVIVGGFAMPYKMGDARVCDGGCSVLVYKSPGCHPGDVRKLRHVTTPTIDEMLKRVDSVRANAVLFSTQSKRAAADEIAGSDYDGDEFVVLADQTLVGLFYPSDPWSEPVGHGGGKAQSVSAAHESDETLQRQLVQNVLGLRHNSTFLVGSSANAITAYSDALGPRHASVLKLVDVYYGALDGALDCGDDCRRLMQNAKKWPRWMDKKTKKKVEWVDSRPNSVMGALFAHLEPNATTQPQQYIYLDNQLILPGSERYLSKWRKIRTDYGRAVSESCRETLVRRHEDAATSNGALFGAVVHPSDELLREVSAVYQVTYKHAKVTQEKRRDGAFSGVEDGAGVGFVWGVCGDLLVFLKSRASHSAAINEGTQRSVCPV